MRARVGVVGSWSGGSTSERVLNVAMGETPVVRMVRTSTATRTATPRSIEVRSTATAGPGEIELLETIQSDDNDGELAVMQPSCAAHRVRLKDNLLRISATTPSTLGTMSPLSRVLGIGDRCWTMLSQRRRHDSVTDAASRRPTGGL